MTPVLLVPQSEPECALSGLAKSAVELLLDAGLILARSPTPLTHIHSRQESSLACMAKAVGSWSTSRRVGGRFWSFVARVFGGCRTESGWHQLLLHSRIPPSLLSSCLLSTVIRWLFPLSTLECWQQSDPGAVLQQKFEPQDL